MARARSCTQMLGRDQQNLSVFGPLPGDMMDALVHFYLELCQSQPRVGDPLDNKNPGSRVADPTVAGLVESRSQQLKPRRIISARSVVHGSCSRLLRERDYSKACTGDSTRKPTHNLLRRGRQKRFTKAKPGWSLK